MKRTRSIVSVLVAIILSLVLIGAIFSTSKPAEGTKDFCILYEGKKILTDVHSFEISESDAVFSVETVDGEPIKDYSVVVRAAYLKDDFNVVFNGVDVQSWAKDFAATEYTFSSAGVEKDGNHFTIKNTSLVTIVSEEFPGLDISYENLTSAKNVLQIEVIVSGQKLSISYFVDVVLDIEFSEGSIIC